MGYTVQFFGELLTNKFLERVNWEENNYDIRMTTLFIVDGTRLIFNKSSDIMGSNSFIVLFEDLIKQLKKDFPDIELAGKVSWYGEDRQGDNGYIKFTENEMQVYLGLFIYLSEKDYEPVTKLINSYLENDMKELIKEGLKHV